MKRVAIALALLAAALSFAMGRAEEVSWEGLVVVQGPEPFTVVALVDRDGRSWRLSGPEVDELESRAQGRIVRVTGHVEGDDGIVVETWTLVPEEVRR